MVISRGGRRVWWSAQNRRPGLVSARVASAPLQVRQCRVTRRVGVDTVLHRPPLILDF